MSVEFVFTMPPEELAPNFRSRSHWPKTRAFAAYKYEVYVEALRQQGGRKAPLAPPVTAHTTFCYRVKRNRDDDNQLSSLKALFDGLVWAGVLAKDDGDNLHHAPVTVVVDKTLKAPEVRVRLETA